MKTRSARLAARLAATLLALPSTIAAAHGVDTRIEQREVVIVEARTRDGRPLADARFDVRLADDTHSVQSGRTDSAGRAAILPVPGRALEVRIASPDGHGARLRLPEPPPVAPPAVHHPPPPAPTTDATPTFAWRDLLAGLGFILGIFGLLQLRQRRAKPPR